MDLSPYDYAKMLCESFKRSRELIPEEKVEELITELQALFPDIPDKVARMYIELHNETLKKRKRKRKRKKKTKKVAPKPKVKYTKAELKIKKVIDVWLDFWDRKPDYITHPYTLLAKATMELPEVKTMEAWAVLVKMNEEGNMYVK